MRVVAVFVFYLPVFYLVFVFFSFFVVVLFVCLLVWAGGAHQSVLNALSPVV